MKRSLSRRFVLVSLGAAALAPHAIRATDALPEVIRFGGVGYGYGKPYGQHLVAVLHDGRYVEQELRAAGTRAEYHFYDRTGPAINEALAAGQLDFASYGELPQIIGRAAGLPTRIVANGGVSNIYVAVRTGVKAQSIRDLRGLRVTLQRGTILHQALDRLLAEAGLSERDVQLYDLPTADQLAALTSGEVDASVGVASLLTLRDQGLVRVIYSTAGKATPDGLSAFSVNEEFARKYPAAVHAVVRAYVRAARWTADERNREQVFDIWAKSGTPRKLIAQDITGPLKLTDIPVIDGLFVNGFKIGVAFALQNKLIRQSIDVDAWIDRSYLDAALRELRLAAFWPARPVPPAFAAR
jgi:sulfonate transport system substrate-binding protein